MAILFAASELEAFQLSSITDITGVTTADTFDTTTARAGMRIQNNAVATVDFAAQSEGWIHMRVFGEDPGGFSTPQTFVWRLVDSGSGEVGVFRMAIDGNEADIEILNTNPTGWVVPTSSIFGKIIWDTTAKATGNTRWDGGVGVFPDDSSITIDFHWLISDTVGIMETYINGILVASFTSGDTLRLTQSTVDRLELSNGNNGGAGRGIIFTEVIIADEDTRGMRVVTLDPAGNGNSTAWTGTVLDIDETALNDTDLVSSNTTTEKELFTAGNTVNDHYDIMAFVLGFRGQDDVSGVQQLKTLLRTASTDFNGATFAMPAAFDGHYEVFNQNPNTVAAWTPSEIDALEYGVESLT